jgi:ATP-binding cassette subfamily F protein uup
MSAIVTVQDVHKSFGPRRVLDGVSFAVHERDRIGLIGPNGSGKSTLMRMLATREVEPDDGAITLRRGLRLEYVPQEPRLPPAATVGEVLGRDDEVPEHERHVIAAALGLPSLRAEVGALSLGERRRVALARALLSGAELLALDEPTNHLDARTVEWLEERLAGRAGALLLVTHDRYFLDRVVTRTLELDRGQLYAHDGDYTAFLQRQAERLAVAAEHERVRAAFVRRELDWIRRGPAARTTKQKARIDRFDAAVAAGPGADAQPRGLTLRLPTGGRLGRTILELHGLGRRVTTPAGTRALFADLTLTLKPGDRIGIVGANGAGKTTLIRTILGLEPPDAGRVVVGQNTTPAYLEQGRTELRDDLTVLAEVAGDSDHVHLEDGPVHVRTFLRMMGFADATADTPIAKLSGGERNRVQLARLLRRGGNLLVLDEPTNDLDLPTLGALEDALLAFPGCALIVSHDRWFLDRVATGILALEGDGEATFWEGDWSSYAARRAARQRSAAPPPAASPSAPVAAAPARGRPAGPRKLSFKERAELGGIEAAISAAEQRVTALEAELSDPATFKDRGAEVPAAIAALEAARAEVERLFARWGELDAIRAAEEAR